MNIDWCWRTWPGVWCRFRLWWHAHFRCSNFLFLCVWVSECMCFFIFLLFTVTTTLLRPPLKWFIRSAGRKPGKKNFNNYFWISTDFGDEEPGISDPTYRAIDHRLPPGKNHRRNTRNIQRTFFKNWLINSCGRQRNYEFHRFISMGSSIIGVTIQHMLCHYRQRYVIMLVDRIQTWVMLNGLLITGPVSFSWMRREFDWTGQLTKVICGGRHKGKSRH